MKRMRLLALFLSLTWVLSGADTVRDLEDRGRALKAKGDAAGALEVYEQAAHLDPKSAALQDEVGFLLAVLNRRAEAIESFQRALDLDPKFAPAQYHLGAAYWLEQNPALGIPHLQSAAALDPTELRIPVPIG